MKHSAVAGCLLLLAGCALPPVGDEPVDVIQGPIPHLADTPTSQALACLARSERPTGFDLRMAVGEVPDRTGRFDYEDTGAFVTQGATYMLISALARAGVPQVNRSTVGIAEWELEQAVGQRLGEGRPVRVGDQLLTYRPVPRGSLTGSTHYVTGAITELDFNVYQRANEVSIGGIGGGARAFVGRIGIDLAVTDTRSTEIVLSRSYRKQVVGYEIRADVFRIFDIGGGVGQIEGDELFDVAIASQPNEPLQGAVRWVIEAAAYDIAAEMLGTGNRCDAFLNEAERRRRQQARNPVPVDAAQAAPAALSEGELLTGEGGGEGAGGAPLAPSTLDRSAPSVSETECRRVAGRMVCGNAPNSGSTTQVPPPIPAGPGA